jgi:hypothetical protein
VLCTSLISYISSRAVHDCESEKSISLSGWFGEIGEVSDLRIMMRAARTDSGTWSLKARLTISGSPDFCCRIQIRSDSELILNPRSDLSFGFLRT